MSVPRAGWEPLFQEIRSEVPVAPDSVLEATDLGSVRACNPRRSDRGFEDIRNAPRMGAGVPPISLTVCDCG